MKKTISVLLAIMMIMLSLLPTMVLAEERDKTYDVTLGEIQQELIDYASIAGSKIVPGTDSYYDYVVNQLLNHSDQKLCEHPHYDLIHAYMAEYKVTYEDYLFCREADDSYKEDIINAITRSNDCVRANVGNDEVTLNFQLHFCRKRFLILFARMKKKKY